MYLKMLAPLDGIVFLEVNYNESLGFIGCHLFINTE